MSNINGNYIVIGIDYPYLFNQFVANKLKPLVVVENTKERVYGSTGIMMLT